MSEGLAPKLKTAVQTNTSLRSLAIRGSLPMVVATALYEATLGHQTIQTLDLSIYECHDRPGLPALLPFLKHPAIRNLSLDPIDYGAAYSLIEALSDSQSTLSSLQLTILGRQHSHRRKRFERMLYEVGPLLRTNTTLQKLEIHASGAFFRQS